MLYLKRIRLHHKVLSGISFNAFKLMIENFQIVKLNRGDHLYVQGSRVHSIFFVLYGAVMVKLTASEGQ